MGRNLRNRLGRKMALVQPVLVCVRGGWCALPCEVLQGQLSADLLKRRPPPAGRPPQNGHLDHLAVLLDKTFMCWLAMKCPRTRP